MIEGGVVKLCGSECGETNQGQIWRKQDEGALNRDYTIKVLVDEINWRMNTRKGKGKSWNVSLGKLT